MSADAWDRRKMTKTSPAAKPAVAETRRGFRGFRSGGGGGGGGIELLHRRGLPARIDLYSARYSESISD